MGRMGAIALLGILSLAPAAQAADTPAFVNATLCDVAAPLAGGTPVSQRQIRFDRPLRAAARNQDRTPAGKRSAARARQVPAARPAPVEPVAESAEETEAVLRPAVHFCVTPGGAANPVRYT